MKLVIRLFAIVGLSALTFGSVWSQTNPRTKTEKTSQAPAGTPKPRMTTPPPRSADRAADRSTGNTNSATRPANTASGSGNAGTTRLMPSVTSLRNTNAGRPATYTNSQGATAKSAPKSPKKVAAIKSTEKGQVNWMTIEQALEKCKVEKRKIFVDVYTDWCGWCKHMDSTTFVNASVAKYLNEHYYAVKFNAEQTQDVVIKDKTYHFKKTGSRGHHELAAYWLNNRLSYPTVVFLDENQQLIQPVPGYQDATKMEAIINYFGSDNHKKTPWETYEKNFVSPQR